MATRWDANAVLKDLTLIVEDTVTNTRTSLVPKICSMKDPDGAYTRIPIADNIAMPRKFERERSSQGKDITIVMNFSQDTYELTIDLDVDLLEDGKAYDQSDIVREATESFEQFPDYLCSQVVLNGSSQVGYDGQNFYGTGHTFAKSGTNTFQNTVAATGQTVVALGTDLASAVKTIKTVRDSKGRLLNQQSKYSASDLLIQCSAALEVPFRTLLNTAFAPVSAPVTTSGTAATTGSNIWQGQADLFVDGYIDANGTPNAWFLHYVSKAQKPFVYLENYATRVKVLGPDSEFCTNTNKCRIALKRRFVLGYYRTDRSIKVS